MVVKEDGTKWACQSCLKGHRVSGCTHTDRELTLVPKKGRPVTQCQHCRLERKKRSAHVKCDCGEIEKPHHPKEKCIHLREAEERAKAGFHDEQQHHLDKDVTAAHLAAVAEEQGCCCSHGGKCSCSLPRKDSDRSLDGVPPHGPAVHKPRLESARSDSSITVFANHHHRPIHRKNHAAHECGMPYKMPMSRAHTDQNVATIRRSVDSLPLDCNMNLDSSAGTNFFQQPDASFSQRRLSKSEQPSPKLSAATPYNSLTNAKLSLDFSSLGSVHTNGSIDSAADDTVMFPPLDPMSSVTDASYDPWSAFPSADAGNFADHAPFGAWATNFDGNNVAQPALTAASSGTQSEIDEIPPIDEAYGFPMPSIQENAGAFGADTFMSDNGNSNRRSLPPSFFGNTDFTLPGMANEWQLGVRDSADNKSKSAGSNPTFEDSWQTPTMSTIANTPYRLSPMPLNPGRPQSHSIGPGNVPSDDLIKQLFPDIDIGGGGMFGAANSPQVMDSPALKRLVALPAANPTSTPMSYSSSLDGAATNAAGFAARPWDDGSISVPADSFANPYNLEPDFSNPDFPSEWPAQ